MTFTFFKMQSQLFVADRVYLYSKTYTYIHSPDAALVQHAGVGLASAGLAQVRLNKSIVRLIYNSC